MDAPDLAGDWQVGGSLRRAGTGYRFGRCTDLPQGRLKCACILAHHVRKIVCLSNIADPSLVACCLFKQPSLSVIWMEIYGPMDMFEKMQQLFYEAFGIEASESQQGLRYQLAAGDAALAPDLSFLSVETVRVSIDAWTHTRWDGCTS